MGTKNHPGKFDCYDAALPDEPMFVLLGRDRLAGAFVKQWARQRQAAGDDSAKVTEAIACAEAMQMWARSLGKTPAWSVGDRAIDEYSHHGTITIVESSSVYFLPDRGNIGSWLKAEELAPEEPKP